MFAVIIDSRMESDTLKFSDTLQSQIMQYIGDVKSTRKGWQKRNCMLCHTQGHNRDVRGRFGIRFSPDGSIAVNCFNCGYDAVWEPGGEITAKFRVFLQELGMTSHDIQSIVFQAYKDAHQVQHGSTTLQLKGPATSSWKEIELPQGAKSVKSLLEEGCTNPDLIGVAEYAISRRMYDLDTFYWSPLKLQQFNRRLILPFRYKDKIVGYTGRYYKEINTKAIPKYLNTMPDNFVFNLDKQASHDTQFVILCEGVLDAHLTNGISPINNTLNQEQIDLINGLGKTVIVCPDRDVAGDVFVQVALEQGWQVAFPKWEKGIKDPAKAVEVYGRILTVQSILESAEKNPVKIQVTWSLDLVRYKRIHKGY